MLGKTIDLNVQKSGIFEFKILTSKFRKKREKSQVNPNSINEQKLEFCDYELVVHKRRWLSDV